MTELIIEEMVVSAALKISHKQIDFRSVSYDPKFRADDYYRDIPDLNPIYRETIIQHDRVAVHASEAFPFHILKTKAPNQLPDEWEYQKGIYEPYTLSTWDRAANKTRIIGNKQNYSIRWPNDEQRKYFYDDYPAYHSLESFFFDVVRPRKINYPNQVLLVKPRRIPTKEVEGEEKPDQSVMIEPVAVIIEEPFVVDYSDNEYLLILLKRKCNYKVGAVTRNDGLIFEYYDKTAIYEAMQVGIVKNKPVFEVRKTYEHNYGFLPARKLGGIPEMFEDGSVFYKSHFNNAIPDLNDVIRISSTQAMSTNKLAYPVIIAVVDPCHHKDKDGNSCEAGKIFSAGTNEHITCPACNGTGNASNHSPTGVYEVRSTVGMNEENKLPMNPVVQFASPDPSILEHTQKQIDNKKQTAFSFLFEVQYKTNTATGVELEKEEWHSFATSFSNEFFDLMDFAIEAAGFMRYGSEFEKPTINRPTNFSFRTADVITAEIKGANDANLPDSYKEGLMDEAFVTRFNSDPRAAKKFNFIKIMDRLWPRTSLEVAGMTGRTCTKEEAILHDSLTVFIDQLEEEDERFWEKSYDEQKKLIDAKVAEIIASLTPEGQDAGAEGLLETPEDISSV